jgi:hypothetical protein
MIGTLALVAGAVLSGCSVLPASTPYYIYPPPILQRPAPPPTRPMVSICYDGQQRSEATVKQMIDAACSDPKFLRTDHTGNCTLLQPVRVTYSCSRVDAKVMTVTPPYGAFVKTPRGTGTPARTGSAPSTTTSTPTPPPAPEAAVPQRAVQPLLDENQAD